MDILIFSITLISIGISALLVRWAFKKYGITKQYHEAKNINTEETPWDILERRRKRWFIIFFMFIFIMFGSFIFYEIFRLLIGLIIGYENIPTFLELKQKK